MSCENYGKGYITSSYVHIMFCVLKKYIPQQTQFNIRFMNANYVGIKTF